MKPHLHVSHRARLRFGLLALIMLAVSGIASAQQESIDPDTMEWIRNNGGIRDLAFEQRYPEPATLQAVHLLLLEGEPDSITAHYLDHFLPPLAPPGASALDLLGDLRALTDTLASYGWVTPGTFADELRSYLDQAEYLLLEGWPSLADGSLFAFRWAVYEAHAEPQPGVREVSREAEVFLWSAATHTIHRLE